MKFSFILVTPSYITHGVMFMHTKEICGGVFFENISDAFVGLVSRMTFITNDDSFPGYVGGVAKAAGRRRIGVCDLITGDP